MALISANLRHSAYRKLALICSILPIPPNATPKYYEQCHEKAAMLKHDPNSLMKRKLELMSKSQCSATTPIAPSKRASASKRISEFHTRSRTNPASASPQSSSVLSLAIRSLPSVIIPESGHPHLAPCGTSPLHEVRSASMDLRNLSGAPGTTKDPAFKAGLNTPTAALDQARGGRCGNRAPDSLIFIPRRFCSGSNPGQCLNVEISKCRDIYVCLCLRSPF